jgi:hypothetical protein
MDVGRRADSVRSLRLVASGAGTLGEKLYGQGRARLGADHPALRFRSIADLPGS